MAGQSCCYVVEDRGTLYEVVWEATLQTRQESSRSLRKSCEKQLRPNIKQLDINTDSMLAMQYTTNLSLKILSI